MEVGVWTVLLIEIHGYQPYYWDAIFPHKPELTNFFLLVTPFSWMIRTQLKPESSHTMYFHVIIRISPIWRLEGSAITNMHDWLNKASFTEKKWVRLNPTSLTTVTVTELLNSSSRKRDLGTISTLPPVSPHVNNAWRFSSSSFW